MATSRISGVIQHLRRAVLLQDGAGLTDGQLLEHFISRRDEAALAVLVRRHGPMVWGVCRRILHDYHDAEDAFQVTFLILVRKAASVLPRGMVANWLYGVARQTALKARATVAKRQGRERQVVTMPEPLNRSQGPGVRSQGSGVSHQEWNDLQALLDEELSRMPDKYRAVVVLCDLEGKTRKEAARQLGVPEGTIAGRLARARTMLARRLARHGVAVSGSALAALVSQQAAAAFVPSSVFSSTIKAAIAFAAGKADISVNVAILTEGVLKVMLLNKLKTMMSLLLVLGMVAFGGGWFFHHAAFGHEVASAEREGEKSANQQAILGTKDAPNPKTGGEKAPEPGLKKETLQSKEGKAHQVTYAVADLVVPIEGLDVALGSNQKKPIKTKEDWLIKKIMRTVSPASWAGSGGTGTIDYFPLGMTLVVNNTPRVQAQVKYLLETMRRQDVQIAADTRIMSLNAAGFRQLQGLVPQLKKDGHAVLSEAETVALLGKVQDDADTKVVQTPKVTFFPGQRVSLCINPCKESPGINVKFNGLVAANLQHLELEVNATIGKTEFGKAMRLEDGVTLAQLNRNGDGYLMLLVTPRVILNLEPEVTAPPTTPQPAPHRAALLPAHSLSQQQLGQVAGDFESYRPFAAEVGLPSEPRSDQKADCPSLTPSRTSTCTFPSPGHSLKK